MTPSKLLALFFAVWTLSACDLPFISPGKSGLQVTSSPTATIYLDGNSLGSSPVIKEDMKPGEYTVKITPQDATLQPWETRIKLTAGVLTVVDRKLAPTLDQSHGYTLSFEKLTQKNKSEIAVTTLPDSVNVNIDGSPQGFTPVTLDSISAGEHTIILSSPGFEDKVIKARSVDGYRLTIAAQLAKRVTLTDETLISPEATPSSTPTPSLKLSPTAKVTPKLTVTPSKTSTPSAAVKTPPAKPYIEVLTTPTGWLRVRSTASSAGTELAKINTGEYFPYLDTDPSGWTQIEYATGKQGWVSTQYIKVVR
ncbi:hypothetical protein A2368_03305 [Candidatus Collierbacteria bacterium RIFOXYB1_FULL_49_13]|uniref:SH3b domain-containing protein n=1 Tax=Candidatus Collierbacteria bacterium RIFOXYB1_FULL_49_13 TaxID=1817728 RepID=A0A1F5FGM8_9BACT|nr:MAG: hypothetical protein A2368_03305 [Candidatus Collierbacteria bacterium RIFOXYB1_FULL_49_13]